MRRYLSAIDIDKPGRSASRTADTVGNRIMKVDELMVSADPVTRLHLIQERIELHAELVRLNQGDELDRNQLERQFVRVGRSYGDRHGLTYAAWRQAGVDAAVLESAGIRRARTTRPAAAPNRSSADSQASVASDRSGTGPATGRGPQPTAAPAEYAAPVGGLPHAGAASGAGAGKEAPDRQGEKGREDVLEAEDGIEQSASGLQLATEPESPLGVQAQSATDGPRVVGPNVDAEMAEDPWEAAMLEAVGIRQGRGQANGGPPNVEAQGTGPPLHSDEKAPSRSPDSA